MTRLNTPLSVGVAAYSFPCSCGLAQRDGKPRLANPMSAFELIDLAAEHRLSGVEIPFDGFLPEVTPASIDDLARALRAKSMNLVLDTAVVDVPTLTRLLPLAARAGVRVVRGMASGILEGARTSVAGGWDAHLEEIRRRIAQIVPLLKDLGLVLAIENHQDCTSQELLGFCDIDPDHVGVTFDVVNPLAVAEDPFEFARALGPHIRDIHIKDYSIRATSQGYRLIRAAIGQGVIDWPAMLTLLREIAPGALLNIELAAIYGRHIRVFEPEWWSSFPERPARSIAQALQFMASRAVPDSVPWRTPWERDDPPEETLRYELAQFAHSVAYLKLIAHP